MIFSSLEDVKKYCESNLQQKPTLRIQNSQIGQTQVPPKRTYDLTINMLPPDKGLEEVKFLKKLEEELKSQGFDSKVSHGSVDNGEEHLQILVQDMQNPKYAKGQIVKFPEDPSKPPREYRVKGFVWDKVAREFVYSIYHEESGQGFNTVGENSLDQYN